eukprot:scaffold283_cov316-Pavlova_lutheri.AAC.45
MRKRRQGRRSARETQHEPGGRDGTRNVPGPSQRNGRMREQRRTDAANETVPTMQEVDDSSKRTSVCKRTVEGSS